jgi:hypothetical protein
VTESPVTLPPSLSESSMLQRSQTKPTLQSRLLVRAVRLKDEANALPYGPLRDAAIRKARQAETASHMSEWLSSPGLEAPR